MNSFLFHNLSDATVEGNFKLTLGWNPGYIDIEDNETVAKLQQGSKSLKLQILPAYHLTSSQDGGYCDPRLNF